MLDAPLAPYLLWAKTRARPAVDLAGSNVLACRLADLPGAREALDLSAPNDLGFAPLVEAIAAHYRVDSTRVATAAGCSGANFLAVAAFVGAGDRVLVERPAYDPLIGACRVLGAEIVRFDRRRELGYGIEVGELRRLVAASRPRLILLSSPHNPSGVWLTRDEIAEVGAIADAVGAHVLVDEVYLDAAAVVRGDAPASHSAASLDGPFVVTNSLTKSYGLSGLRCGWVIASKEIAERIRRTRDLVDNIASAPADRLALLAFVRLPDLAARTRAILAANLDRARRFFDGQDRLQVVAAPAAASIVFPRLGDGEDATPFAEFLASRHGVAVAPGAFFDAPDCLRIGIGGDPDTVDRGLRAIADGLAAWPERRDA